MKEKPILFKGPMVVAVQNGRKTQTRRVCDPKIWGLLDEIEKVNGKPHWQCLDFDVKCPWGVDQLWVRETWRPVSDADYWDCVEYRADGKRMKPEGLTEEQGFKFNAQCEASDDAHPIWKPSIFLPRWASRIQLEVTDVRVERVQDIGEEDALAEGVVSDHAYADDPDAKLCACPQCNGTGLHEAAYPPDYGVTEVDCTYCDTPRKRFMILWDGINNHPPKRPYGWGVNPWVWSVTFKKI